MTNSWGRKVRACARRIVRFLTREVEAGQPAWVQASEVELHTRARGAVEGVWDDAVALLRDGGIVEVCGRLIALHPRALPAPRPERMRRGPQQGDLFKGAE